MPAGTKIWVYYNTSKQNERPRWFLATVKKAENHITHCCRSEKRPPLTVAYKHICLAPKLELTEELMSHSLEAELHIEEPIHAHNSLNNQSECQSLHLDAPAELRDI